MTNKFTLRYMGKDGKERELKLDFDKKIIVFKGYAKDLQEVDNYEKHRRSI